MPADPVNTSTGVIYIIGPITLTGGVSSTGIFTQTSDGIAATSTDGLILQNTTASTVGVTSQWSPRIHFSGTAWKSNATAASQVNDLIMELRPVTGTASTTGNLVFAAQSNGGGYTDIFSLNSASGLTITGAIAASSTLSGTGISTAVSSYFNWTGRTVLRSPADAQFNINNAAENSGIGFDISTNSTLKVRTTAQSGYGTVDALAYKVSGTDQTPASGVYTATFTNVANLDGTPASVECNYLRVGATVTVSGKVVIDPTTTLTDTQVGISLPVASDFGAVEDCCGVAYSPAIAAQGAAILADATNNRANMQFKAVDTTAQTMAFTFTYQVI